MGKSRKDRARAAHIKRHTKGTSNEISLDVLDAARDRLDDRSQGDALGPQGLLPSWLVPEVRLGPLSSGANGRSLGKDGHRKGSKRGSPKAGAHSGEAIRALRGQSATLDEGDAAPALTSDELEIISRKRRRRSRRNRRHALAAAIIVVVTIAACFAGYHAYRAYDGAQTRLDDLVAGLDGMGEGLALVNEAMEDPVGNAAAGDIVEAEEAIPGLRERIDELEEEAEAFAAAYEGTSFGSAADQIASSLAARRAMLESAAAVFGAADDLQAGLVVAQTAWDDLMSAVDAANEAADALDVAEGSSSSATDEAVAASLEASERARSLFNQAADGFSQAQGESPALDLSAYAGYAHKRAEAEAFAIEADRALLDRDRDGAVAADEAYEKAVEEAVEMSASLDDSLDQTALDSFARENADAIDAYRTARSQASAADSMIRDYFGHPLK